VTHETAPPGADPHEPGPIPEDGADTILRERRGQRRSFSQPLPSIAKRRHVDDVDAAAERGNPDLAAISANP
jgi:hypothetical protein